MYLNTGRSGSEIRQTTLLALGFWQKSSRVLKLNKYDYTIKHRIQKNKRSKTELRKKQHKFNRAQNTVKDNSPVDKEDENGYKCCSLQATTDKTFSNYFSILGKFSWKIVI